MIKKKGNTETQIARALSRDRKTVKRALLQTADNTFSREKRVSVVPFFVENFAEVFFVLNDHGIVL